MSATMRAAAIDAFGPPEALTVHDLPRPEPTGDELLVRVLRAGVQPVDTAFRSGDGPPVAEITFPQVIGNEFAGVVAAVGPDVAGFAVGDAVLGFRVLGCYAEYVAVPQSQVVAKPDAMPWDVAGVLSASGQTAHTAIEELAVAAGETVLVHGAAGGVGTVFTQLAVLRGARVIGTSAPEHHDYLRGLGAVPVGYGDGQVERIRAAAGERVDAAFDTAGHGNLRDALTLVGDRDRIATIAGIPLAGELGIRFLRSQRSTTRLAELADLVARGELRVHIRRAYPLADAPAAHHDIERGHGRGKIVLRIADEP